MSGMPTSGGTTDERVEGFKPTLNELQLLGRNVQEEGAVITQRLPGESKDLVPLVGKNIVFGFVEEVHGASARLVDLVKVGTINRVFVSAADRLSRNIRQWMTVKDEIEQSGARIVIWR